MDAQYVGHMTALLYRFFYCRKAAE